MLTFEKRIIASGDDTFRTSAGAAFSSVTTVVAAGKNAIPNTQQSSMRFTGVLVPQGAVIVAAYITLTANFANAEQTIRTIINGNDVDDAVAPTNAAEFDALVKTAATVDWDGIDEFVVDVEYNTPSLVPIVQEIVKRPGFAGAMQFIWSDDASDVAARRRAASWDDDPAKAPLLHIDYETPPPPVPNPPGGSFGRRLSGGAGGFLSYITPDGRTYPFHTPHNIGRWVISFSGFGTPPIEYITERGPFQHGETVRDYFLRPRVIQLFIRQAFCDRVAWWGGRADLLNEIRPNRQSTPTGVDPGELQLVETDGTVRSLNVFIQEGPRFEPRESGEWDEWAFMEVLRFIAYDPVAFDPTQATAAFLIAVATGELVFPITFPIQFGTGALDETLAVTYPGTWQSFPVITIVGPIEQPRLDNVTTGEKIEFSIDIAAGRTITIDLTEGNKTVVDDLGTNLIGAVTPDSDLGTFHLAPDPEAPLGVNTLRLRGTNPTGATAVSLAYFERYFGF